MKKLTRIGLYVLIAVAITSVCEKLESEYLAKFLKDKLVEVLITLLAINIATCGILVSKIQELTLKYNADFSSAKEEIKRSLVYQIWLIGATVVVLILYHSKYIQSNLGSIHEYIFDTLITAIFICAIDILRDTGMAIFVINSK